MPTSTLQEKDLEEDGRIGAISLLVACGLASSRGEARRLIQQGGITVNDNKVETIDLVLDPDTLSAGVKIRKGKKVFHRAVIE